MKNYKLLVGVVALVSHFMVQSSYAMSLACSSNQVEPFEPNFQTSIVEEGSGNRILVGKAEAIQESGPAQIIQNDDIFQIDEPSPKKINANLEFIESAKAGDFKKMQSLLDSAYVDTIDNQGNTALMYVARKGSIDLAMLLVSRGANPIHLNDKNELAIHWVQYRNQNSHFEMIQARGMEMFLIKANEMSTIYEESSTSRSNSHSHSVYSKELSSKELSPLPGSLEAQQ